MQVKVLSVKDLANGIEKDSVTQINAIKERGQSVKVACVLLGDSPALSRFAAERGAACQKAGIGFSVKVFPDSVELRVLDERLSDFSRDNNWSGIIVATGYESEITAERSLKNLPKYKDVEIAHPENIAGFLIDAESCPAPPLAAAVNALFVTHEIDLYQKSILVAGNKDRSLLPLTSLLLSQSAVVTCAKSIQDIRKEVLSGFDIIICSEADRESVSGKDIKVGAVLVDAGAQGPGSLTQHITGGGCFAKDIADKAGAIVPAGALKQLENAFFIHNVLHFARTLEERSPNKFKAVVNKNTSDNSRNNGN